MNSLILKSTNLVLKDYDKGGTVVFVANSFNIEDAAGDRVLTDGVICLHMM